MIVLFQFRKNLSLAWGGLSTKNRRKNRSVLRRFLRYFFLARKPEHTHCVSVSRIYATWKTSVNNNLFPEEKNCYVKTCHPPKNLAATYFRNHLRGDPDRGRIGVCWNDGRRIAAAGPAKQKRGKTVGRLVVLLKLVLAYDVCRGEK